MKRDGKWIDAAARELVPGDVIRVRLGDIVPADARLLAGDPVEVDQSALDRRIVARHPQAGRRRCSPGRSSARGRSTRWCTPPARTRTSARPRSWSRRRTPSATSRRAVLKIGDYLIMLAVALVVVIIAVAIFRGDPILTTLQFALVLTVAAIPVAMPTVLSVTMAVGARLLAKKEAIVSRLAAIEELAGRGHPLLRQDRHADAEQAHAGRPVLRRRRCGRPGHPRAPRWRRARKTRTPSTWPCSAA